jgi:hypothetical protein
VVIDGHQSGLEAKGAVIINESKGVLVNSSSSSDYRSIVHAVRISLIPSVGKIV